MTVRQAQGDRETFTDGAARLAGQVPRLLGWRPQDFWDATPAELAAILTPPEQAAAEPLSRRVRPNDGARSWMTRSTP